MGTATGGTGIGWEAIDGSGGGGVDVDATVGGDGRVPGVDSGGFVVDCGLKGVVEDGVAEGEGDEDEDFVRLEIAGESPLTTTIDVG